MGRRVSFRTGKRGRGEEEGGRLGEVGKFQKVQINQVRFIWDVIGT